RIVRRHRCRLASLTERCYTIAMQLSHVPHPATPPADPTFKVWVNVEHAGALGVVASTNIWFGVGAPASRFLLPEPAADVRRAERLWEATCFETFLRVSGETAY